MSMGQFIDHDISRTAVVTLAVDDDGKICQSFSALNMEPRSGSHRHGQNFRLTHIVEIHFTR